MSSELGAALALGASGAWAISTVLALKPLGKMGSFFFIRLQMVSSAIVLLLLATFDDAWASVDWHLWPTFAASALVGVLLPNLAFAACLSRTGPGLAQVLFATRTPMTAVLGFLLFGQALAGNAVLAIALVSIGVAMVAMVDRFVPVMPGAPSRLWVGVVLGIIAAAGNAIGIIILLPAVDAGTHPLAISAVRLSMSAAMLVVLLWHPAMPSSSLRVVTRRDVQQTILSGILGYVTAVTLQLWSLQFLNAGVSAALSSLAPVLVLPIMWLATRRPARPLAWLGAVVVCAGVAMLRL